jgi:hypothetical protein
MPVPSTSQSHNVLFFLGNKLIIIELDPGVVSLLNPRYIMARVSTASLVRQHPTQLILPCTIGHAMTLDMLHKLVGYFKPVNSIAASIKQESKAYLSSLLCASYH